MDAQWEQFRANVNKLEVFADILREQDRMLGVKLEEKRTLQRRLAHEVEVHELEREDISSKLASIANKMGAVMRGETVSVDEDDPLRALGSKRRHTLNTIDDEPGKEFASHNAGPTRPSKQVGMPVCLDHEQMGHPSDIEGGRASLKGKPFGSHLAYKEKIHDKYPTVIRLDGVWVELSCATCGANGGKKEFFRSLLSFRTHFNTAHPRIGYTGLGFCERRAVSDADVQAMKEGRQPEVPIVRKTML